jgi:ubiquinone/menaquinone biosynthesis C-methylase UbiE
MTGRHDSEQVPTPLDPSDFASRAATYDELRPLDDGALDLIEEVVREAELKGRRVLDVGCGTGRLAAHLAERHGAQVCGVDPSAEMLAVAEGRRTPRVDLVLGRAEELPFLDGRFERAVMFLVVQHVNRPRAFAELARVLTPGGRFSVATPHPDFFTGYWMAELFPSYVQVERARFPSEATLGAEFRAAGFASSRFFEHWRQRSYSRELVLRRIRGRYASTFDLISDDEYRAGLARAEQELPETIKCRSGWLIAIADVADASV